MNKNSESMRKYRFKITALLSYVSQLIVINNNYLNPKESSQNSKIESQFEFSCT